MLGSHIKSQPVELNRNRLFLFGESVLFQVWVYKPLGYVLPREPAEFLCQLRKDAIVGSVILRRLLEFEEPLNDFQIARSRRFTGKQANVLRSSAPMRYAVALYPHLPKGHSDALAADSCRHVLLGCARWRLHQGIFHGHAAGR